MKNGIIGGRQRPDLKRGSQGEILPLPQEQWEATHLCWRILSNNPQDKNSTLWCCGQKTGKGRKRVQGGRCDSGEDQDLLPWGERMEKRGKKWAYSDSKLGRNLQSPGHGDREMEKWQRWAFWFGQLQGWTRKPWTHWDQDLGGGASLGELQDVNSPIPLWY